MLTLTTHRTRLSVRPTRSGARTRRRMVAGCLAAYGVFATGAAPAQAPPGPAPETGSLVPRKALPKSELDKKFEEQPSDISLAVSRRLASCAARRRPALVRNVFVGNDSANIMRAINSLSDVLSDCAVMQSDADHAQLSFRFGFATYMGILAEAWLKQVVMGKLAPLPASAAPPVSDQPGILEAQVLLTRLANCVAYTQPESAEALVLSLPSSAEEAASFQQVVPHLKACIGEREGLRMNKIGLRLALATAVARRVAANQSTAKAN